jgi:hypothetical protein
MPKKQLTKYNPMNQDEANLLANLDRGSVIGQWVTICRTDFVQAINDPWLANFNYFWNEHLLISRELFKDTNSLDHLIYVPDDLGEIYLVDVPFQAPDYRYLTPFGRQEYELYPGYEEAVNNELLKDYALSPDRSIYHSIYDEENNANHIVQQAMSGRVFTIKLRYEGISYTYTYPQDPVEAEKAHYVTLATRTGKYPDEQSLTDNDKYDLVPAVPDGETARITVREYFSQPKENAPYTRVSFQATELPPRLRKEGQPDVFFTVSLGNPIALNASVKEYLDRHYTDLGIRAPHIRFEEMY